MLGYKINSFFKKQLRSWSSGNQRFKRELTAEAKCCFGFLWGLLALPWNTWLPSWTSIITWTQCTSSGLYSEMPALRAEVHGPNHLPFAIKSPLHRPFHGQSLHQPLWHFQVLSWSTGKLLIPCGPSRSCEGLGMLCWYSRPRLCPLSHCSVYWTWCKAKWKASLGSLQPLPSLTQGSSPQASDILNSS